MTSVFQLQCSCNVRVLIQASMILNADILRRITRGASKERFRWQRYCALVLVSR